MKKNIAFIILLCLLGLDVMGQSGWTKGQGELYSKIGFSTGSTDQYYYLNGELHPGSVLTQQGVSLYGEYGITNSLTGVLNFPLLRSIAFETTDASVGVGDPQIGVKYALWKKIPISFSFSAQIPLASKENKVLIKDGSGKFNLPLGEGDLSFWGTLAISQGFGKGYGSIYGAYNQRTQGYSGRYKVGAELGYKFFDRLWVNAKLIGFSTANNGDPGKATLFNGDGVEFSQLIFGSAFEITKKWSVTAEYLNYNSILFARRNIYSLPTFSLGVSFQK